MTSAAPRPPPSPSSRHRDQKTLKAHSTSWKCTSGAGSPLAWNTAATTFRTVSSCAFSCRRLPSTAV